jgi:hypothetical protein
MLREMIIPAEIISHILPVIHITNKGLIKQLLTGKPLIKDDASIPDADKFSVFDKDNFIGVYKRVREGNIVARAEFVFN